MFFSNLGMYSGISGMITYENISKRGFVDEMRPCIIHSIVMNLGDELVKARVGPYLVVKALYFVLDFLL
jgi:hypothetical protein